MSKNAKFSELIAAIIGMIGSVIGTSMFFAGLLFVVAGTLANSLIPTSFFATFQVLGIFGLILGAIIAFVSLRYTVQNGGGAGQVLIGLYGLLLTIGALVEIAGSGGLAIVVAIIQLVLGLSLLSWGFEIKALDDVMEGVPVIGSFIIGMPKQLLGA